MTTATPRWRRIFTRDDGRDRVAVPFGRGLLVAFAAFALLLAATFLAVLALHLVRLRFGPRVAPIGPGRPAEELAGVLCYAIAGLFAWLCLRALRGMPVFRRFGRRDVVVAIAGVVATILIDRVNDAVLAALGLGDYVQAGFDGFTMVMATKAATIAAVVSSLTSLCVAAPFSEELLLRGLLFGALAGRWGVIAASLVSSIVFAALHGDPVLFPDLAVAGLVLAVCYVATGNLAVPVAVHAASNAIATLPQALDALRH